MGGFRPEDCSGKVKEGGRAAIMTRLHARWSTSVVDGSGNAAGYGRAMSCVDLENWEGLANDKPALELLLAVIDEVVLENRTISLA